LPENASKSENPPHVESWDFLDQFRTHIEELARQREQSEKKAAEYLDKLQRLQADMENLQKIAKRQIETVTKQASEALVVKLLPILDALEQAGTLAHENKSLPPEEVSVGLRMIYKQLLETLGSEGLKEIPTRPGEKLNPETQEVVNYVETDEAPEDTVVEEIRKGYVLNGKVIRPSLVVVSRKKSASDLAASTSGD